MRLCAARPKASVQTAGLHQAQKPEPAEKQPDRQLNGAARLANLLAVRTALDMGYVDRA